MEGEKKKEFACDQCDYKSLRKTDMWRHLRVIHKAGEKCEQCNLTFSSLSHYNQHMKEVHSGIKPHVCLCGYRTSRKSDLRRHTIAHLNSQPVVAKRMKRPVVDGVKLPFTCIQCSYKTIRNSDLMRHIRARHTHERPHICHICNKAFKEKYTLSCHIKHVHLQDKQFNCSICEYKGSRKIHLEQHYRRKHPGIEINFDKPEPPPLPHPPPPQTTMGSISITEAIGNINLPGSITDI